MLHVSFNNCALLAAQTPLRSFARIFKNRGLINYKLLDSKRRARSGIDDADEESVA